jgi:hypothetical protein
VFCDTTLLGVVPVLRAPVGQGIHILHYLHPQGEQWIHPALTETLLVEGSVMLARTARFPDISHITSDPYGAEVRFRDSLLGTTPLFVSLDTLAGMVTITRAGYEAATLPAAREIHAILAPLPGGPASRSVYLSTEQSKSYAPVVAAAGATVLSGAVAAYFKIRADRSYDEYRSTGSSEALDEVHRDDLISGASLAASQLSLLLLGYLLFSR